MSCNRPDFLERRTRHEHRIDEGGGPRRRLFGTRPHRYRCSLPGLAGFAANRREETSASHHKLAKFLSVSHSNQQRRCTIPASHQSEQPPQKNFCADCLIDLSFGGEGEIRTHEGREAPPVFKTGAFNHSATPPVRESYPHQKLRQNGRATPLTSIKQF